jgi:hypothetical protein
VRFEASPVLVDPVAILAHLLLAGEMNVPDVLLQVASVVRPVTAEVAVVLVPACPQGHVRDVIGYIGFSDESEF